VRDFCREHGFPVERSQMAGLRQIAGNEPGLLKEFLDHQRDRAQRRFQSSGQRNEKFAAEIKLWDLVGQLCAGRPPRCEWSLEQDASAAVPAELRTEKLPPGAKLSREEQGARRQRDAARDKFLAEWRLRAYPLFFQHFCAEYLYRKATHSGEEGSNDSSEAD
jgi:hypothetical protein